jgi:L,D-peptidoglycan transpeptidase YkuD (ErfK/YbiS/YcfS/YnhG family)
VRGLVTRPARVTFVLAVRYGSTRVTLTQCVRTAGGEYRQVWQDGGRVGYGGFAAPGTKREGDGRTPSGVFALGTGFGVGDPGSRIGYLRLRPTSCWGSTVGSRRYNTYFVGRCGRSDERLFRYAGRAYRQGMVIEYNTRLIRQGYGSAIFLHVDTGRATAGCVSTTQGTVVRMMRTTVPGDVVVMGVRPAV